MEYLPLGLRIEKEVAPFLPKASGVCWRKEGSRMRSVGAWTFDMMGGSEVHEQIALTRVSRTLKSFKEPPVSTSTLPYPSPSFL